MERIRTASRRKYWTYAVQYIIITAQVFVRRVSGALWESSVGPWPGFHPGTSRIWIRSDREWRSLRRAFFWFFSQQHVQPLWLQTHSRRSECCKGQEPVFIVKESSQLDGSVTCAAGTGLVTWHLGSRTKNFTLTRRNRAGILPLPKLGLHVTVSMLWCLAYELEATQLSRKSVLFYGGGSPLSLSQISSLAGNWFQFVYLHNICL